MFASTSTTSFFTFKPKLFMKKIILSSTLISLFLIASAFKISPAVITDYHDQFTDQFTITNSCNGENVLVTEVFTVDDHIVINNNELNITYHYKIDWTGVGDQGNTYHGVGNIHGGGNIPLVNGAYTYIYNGTMTFVSSGSAPNVKEGIQIKVTVTPNGKVTVDKFNLSSECLL